MYKDSFPILAKYFVAKGMLETHSDITRETINARNRFPIVYIPPSYLKLHLNTFEKLISLR
jgi:hypothetical protein